LTSSELGGSLLGNGEAIFLSSLLKLVKFIRNQEEPIMAASSPKEHGRRNGAVKSCSQANTSLVRYENRNQHVHFFDNEVLAFLGEEPWDAANRAIGRYEKILKRIDVEQLLTRAERAAVTDMSMGTRYEPSEFINELASNWRIVEPLYAEKWGVDRNALFQKLLKLDFVEEIAIIEAIERCTLFPGEERGGAE
jgi:hypothetical protein